MATVTVMPGHLLRLSHRPIPRAPTIAQLPVPFLTAAEIIRGPVLDQLHAPLRRQRGVGPADDIGLPFPPLLLIGRGWVWGDGDLPNSLTLDDNRHFPLDNEDAAKPPPIAMKAAMPAFPGKMIGVTGDGDARDGIFALLRIGLDSGEDRKDDRSSADGQQVKGFHFTLPIHPLTAPSQIFLSYSANFCSTLPDEQFV
jgi:hypothetical protein